MANLLVTGGAGFIGANFVHYWTKHYPRDVIVVLDAMTYASNDQNLASLQEHPSFTFVKGDILDQQLVEDLLRSRRLNVIVNCAAESHVDRSIRNPDACFKTNVEGTHTLLKAARNVWLDSSVGEVEGKYRFHHLSTVEVYGELASGVAPFTERSSYVPSSPYAASKAAADHLVRTYYSTYALPVTISNSPNNFGRFHFPDKLIPLVIHHILQDKPIPLYGDGRQIRDWLYVQDHCRGIEQVLQLGQLGETYHIGTRNEWTNLEMVRFICDYMDTIFKRCSDYRARFPAATLAIQERSRELITQVMDRSGHDRRYGLDSTKIKAELGWQSRYTFKGALEYTIGWYLRHMDWLKNIRKEGLR